MSLIGKAIKYGLVAKLASYAYEKYSEKQHQPKYAAKQGWFNKKPTPTHGYGASEVVADLMNIAQKLRRG